MEIRLSSLAGDIRLGKFMDFLDNAMILPPPNIIVNPPIKVGIEYIWENYTMGCVFVEAFHLAFNDLGYEITTKQVNNIAAMDSLVEYIISILEEEGVVEDMVVYAQDAMRSNEDNDIIVLMSLMTAGIKSYTKFLTRSSLTRAMYIGHRPDGYNYIV